MKETIKYTPYYNWKEFKIMKEQDKKYFVLSLFIFRIK